MNNRAPPRGGKSFIKLPSIFIPIMLFIVFDMVALGLNFWISAKLEHSAVAINLSGRQRMLSQRMTKSLLMLHVAQTDPQKRAAFEEFSYTVDLFDKTLTGFLQGGMTRSGDDKLIFLPAAEALDAQVFTASAYQLWTIVRKELQPVIESGISVNAAVLNNGLNAVLTYNKPLLDLMNNLTTALEQNASQEVFHLRILQAGMLLLALLNFALVCRRLLKQIHQSQNNVQSLRNIIDSIDTGVILYDDKEVVQSANKAANTLFGYSDNALIGRQLTQLIFADNPRMLGIRRDNTTFIAKINTQTLFEFNNQISLCTITDVSEQERKEKELMRMAFHDALTGLPNRVLLMERLQQDLLRAKRDSTLLAVMFVDLDGFKAVNDNMGHDAGDELLKYVGKRFLQCCREVDTVARIGGDEFVFTLTALHSMSAAKQVAHQVLKAVNEAFLIQGETVKIGASVGIALYPNDHSEAELLIKYADEAMYLAKQNGKNRLTFACELH